MLVFTMTARIFIIVSPNYSASNDFKENRSLVKKSTLSEEKKSAQNFVGKKNRW